MTFTFTGALVGPYTLSSVRGRKGDVQKFCFPVMSDASDYFVVAPMITEGRAAITWKEDPARNTEMAEGQSFYLDQLRDKQLSTTEEMTIHALTDLSYFCVSPTGTEQRVALQCRMLAPGERLTVDRFSLLAVAGNDSQIRINGGEIRHGIRAIYAQSSELDVVAASRSLLGVFALCV